MFNPRTTKPKKHFEVTKGGGVVSTPPFCFAIQQNLRASLIQLIDKLKLVGIVVLLLFTKY